MKLLAALLTLALCSCTILPDGAQFWGDYANIKYSHEKGNEKISLSADSMNHSNVVRAHWHGATLLGAEVAPVVGPAIGVAPRVVAPAVPAVVSGFTQPPRATPTPKPTKP